MECELCRGYGHVVGDGCPSKLSGLLDNPIIKKAIGDSENMDLDKWYQSTNSLISVYIIYSSDLYISIKFLMD